MYTYVKKLNLLRQSERIDSKCAVKEIFSCEANYKNSQEAYSREHASLKVSIRLHEDRFDDRANVLTMIDNNRFPIKNFLTDRGNISFSRTYRI